MKFETPLKNGDMSFENKVLILLENMDRKIELSGERMDMLDQKIDRIELKADDLSAKLTRVEASMATHGDFQNHENRIALLKKAVL